MPLFKVQVHGYARVVLPVLIEAQDAALALRLAYRSVDRNYDEAGWVRDGQDHLVRLDNPSLNDVDFEGEDTP